MRSIGCIDLLAVLPSPVQADEERAVACFVDIAGDPVANLFHAVVTVLEGLGAGKKPRGIAEDVWGKEDVAEVWASDSWMRSQVRRWIPKAQALADGGWRDLVPRVLAEE